VRVGEPSPTWNWGDGAGVLETLIVSRRARGNRLGSRLADLALEHFRQAHVPFATVSVVAGNEQAAQLYRRLGGTGLLQTLVMPVQASAVRQP
jgi:ribosomal protein S18 acetylase RimI-like enzyme